MTVITILHLSVEKFCVDFSAITNFMMYGVMKHINFTVNNRFLLINGKFHDQTIKSKIIKMLSYYRI